MKPSQFLGLVAVLLGLACGAGCKGAGFTPSAAQFRVMNASVEQPTLNFLLNSTTVASGLAYPTASDYSQQAGGGYTLHVQAGTTNFINLPVIFQQGQDYTFIAAEAAFASPNLAPIFLTDDNSAPATGKIKLRVVNASPDIGNLDVYVVAPGTSIQNASPTISNLGFTTASGYQILAAGTYEIFFTPAGQKTFVIDSGKMPFTAGQIRTVVALDSTGGFSLSTLSDSH